MTHPEKPLSGRGGFGALTPERRREIARLGGQAVPADQRAFAKDNDLAKRAGRIGGSKGKADA